MRCFIAIDIDEEIRAELDDLQQELAAAAKVRKGDVKWVRPEVMHLTLKFLGEVHDHEIIGVSDAVETVAARHRPFNLPVKEVGCFGGRSARVVWVGAGLECPELLEIQHDLEEELALAGWPREARKFSGHLTLCRIRNVKAGVELATMIERYKDFDLGTMHCDAMCVYQSELKPEGPTYTCLGSYELR